MPTIDTPPAAVNDATVVGVKMPRSADAPCAIAS